MKKILGGRGIPLAFLAALLLLGMMVAITGCSKGSALVGSWQEVEDGKASGSIIEFFEDGTFDTSYGSKGKWKAEKGQVTLTWGGSNFSETHDYKISGTTLTLTEEDGDVETYQKVKK